MAFGLILPVPTKIYFSAFQFFFCIQLCSTFLIEKKKKNSETKQTVELNLLLALFD